MAVKIRMMRMGRRHRPFFRINAVDSRVPQKGKILEKLGHYDPIEKDTDKQVVLNVERVKYWLGQGAIPSDSVSQLLLRQGITHKYAEDMKKKMAKARSAVRAKGGFFTKADKIAAEKAAEKARADAEAKEKEQAQAAKTAEQAEPETTEAVKTEAEPREEEKVQAEEKTETTEEVKAEAEPAADQKAEPKAEEKKKKSAKTQEDKKNDES